MIPGLFSVLKLKVRSELTRVGREQGFLGEVEVEARRVGA